MFLDVIDVIVSSENEVDFINVFGQSAVVRESHMSEGDDIVAIVMGALQQLGQAATLGHKVSELNLFGIDRGQSGQPFFFYETDQPDLQDKIMVR